MYVLIWNLFDVRKIIVERELQRIVSVRGIQRVNNCMTESKFFCFVYFL